MSRPADHSHSVRKVLLPSGKTIEVVTFADEPVAPAPAAQVARSRELQPARDLHRCASCPSALVYPLDWAEAGPRHWEITLRCPNCEWVGAGVFDGESVERFDSELDRATESIIDDLRRLMHANMEADVERFAAALAAGHVVPDDF